MVEDLELLLHIQPKVHVEETGEHFAKFYDVRAPRILELDWAHVNWELGHCLSNLVEGVGDYSETHILIFFLAHPELHFGRSCADDEFH